MSNYIKFDFNHVGRLSIEVLAWVDWRFGRETMEKCAEVCDECKGTGREPCRELSGRHTFRGGWGLCERCRGFCIIGIDPAQLVSQGAFSNHEPHLGQQLILNLANQWAADFGDVSFSDAASVLEVGLFEPGDGSPPTFLLKRARLIGSSTSPQNESSSRSLPPPLQA